MRLSLCQDWHCVLDSQGPQQKSMTRDFETVAGRHERGTRVRFTFENSGGREGLTEREREREREWRGVRAYGVGHAKSIGLLVGHVALFKLPPLDHIFACKICILILP